MENDAQLKLQAYLDGELPESEAREVANWLARDKEAVALHAELRNTRQALVGFEIGVALPESREFFWSKVEREIQRLEKPAPERPKPSWFSAWRRLLVPAAALAALVLAGQVLLTQSPGEGLATTSADPGTFTYRDYASGTTLVWLSYPAENEVAQSQPASTVP
jgi:anti-sigma factor RsiW